jgi:hypothetical protein
MELPDTIYYNKQFHLRIYFLIYQIVLENPRSGYINKIAIG